MTIKSLQKLTEHTFDKYLQSWIACVIIVLRNFEHMFCCWEGLQMKSDYKTAIYKMLNHIDDTDETFLKQLYTLIKKHLERKGRR